MTHKIYFENGIAFQRTRDYVKAIECFRKAIDIKPDFAEAYYQMGMAYGMSNQSYEAIECFRKAIDIKPGFAEAHYNMGVAYAIGYKDYKTAIECYKNAIQYKPDFAPAYLILGITYVKNIGGNINIKQGIEYIKKAVYLGSEQAKQWLRDNGID